MSFFLAAISAWAQAPVSQGIATGWEFRELPAAADVEKHVETESWHAAKVPGEVQVDLQAAGLIPDPFFGDNEKRLQWVGEENWEYRVSFTPAAALMKKQHLELVFDGLDTFADVALNGRPLIKTDNMFRSWRVDVRALLVPGLNQLSIILHSPFQVMTPTVAALPYVLPGTGYEPFDAKKGIYPVGHYIRTAGYPYGWDWGPRLVTMGVWKPVHLEGWDEVRLTNLHVEQQSVNAERALVQLQVEVQAAHAGSARIAYAVRGAHGVAVFQGSQRAVLDAGVNRIVIALRIKHPRRWFPNGYGSQDRYQFVVRISGARGVIDAVQKLVGLRSVELRRQPDAWGTSFAFVMNGIPVFAKGANVIPMDSFPARVTVERERSLLTAAHDANMNMIRVWGGGYYQSDSFYDLCDELGILVWQDFAFGGGLVPGDKAFQDNVHAEAVEQVTRLRDHAALVLWNGNNEVESAWKDWDDHQAFKASVTAEQREQIWQDYVVMFRDILKSVVAEYGGGVPYWASSPSANFEDVAGGERNGDMHSWKVWSAGAPIESYRHQTPRFLSEFGFQAFPDIETVRAFAGDEENLKAPALANHERFLHGYDRLHEYLKVETKEPKDFAGLIYLSQFVQAEAIEIAVEHLRSAMPRSMGTMYWQLNDCWPVVSWSSIDSFGRFKALQYYARRFYAPLLIAPVYEGGAIHTAIVSDEPKPIAGTWRVCLMDFDGRVLMDKSDAVTVPALTSLSLPALAINSVAGFDVHRSYAVLEFRGNDGRDASHTLYFAKARELNLPAANIRATVTKAADGYEISLDSEVLARDVLLTLPDTDAAFSDNNFDLVPGEGAHVHLRIEKGNDTGLESVRRALQVVSMVDMVK